MLTTKEAAKLLGITPRRVQELIKTGALKARKASGVWLVDKGSVDERLRSVNKVGGRPARGRGKSEISFTLMNRTHEVLKVVYNTSRKDFTHIGNDIDPAYAPIGVFTRDRSVSLDAFRLWWRGRGIPTARIGLASLLAEAAVDVPDELIQRNLGLSLSDQYWIKPRESNLAWEDINFFNHDFEDVSLAVAPFAPEGKEADAKPDNTSDGNLQKFWTCKGGQRKLHKSGAHLNQEPYNEAIATELHRRVLDAGEFVPYSLEGTGTSALSVCEDFLTDKEEYIPAHYIARLIDADERLTDYEQYIACCEKLGVANIKSALDRMIVCDDVIANYDRHWRNFGLVRNVETLECRPAPIFDSGSSLWCNVSLEELKAGEHSFTSAQFYSSPAKQMLLVDDMGWFDGDKLDGFVDAAIEILSKNEALDSRLPYLREALEWRVERMIDIAEWS